tara:strand:- start:262 stop:1503 length:1242 start_codon:yes stop_codon:yes gene_type:complete
MIGVAVVGAAFNMLAPARTQPVVVHANKVEQKKKEKKELELTPNEKAAIDEAQITKVILDQIDKTPNVITGQWLDSMCTFVKNEQQLQTLIAAGVERGEKFDIGYTEDFKKKNPRKIMPEDPRVYISFARSLIHKPGIKEYHLMTTARGHLDMALYREHKFAQDESEKEGSLVEMRDEVVSSWFKQTLRLYEKSREISLHAGGGAASYRREIIEIIEAIIVDRHYLITRRTAEARRRYSENTSSAKPVTLRIGSWNKTLNSNLLKLGKVYVDAAESETTYKNRQQEYADRGFMILAMVHQRTKGPDALGILRKNNRIQRYNMWKMGQAHWGKAKRAAVAGKYDIAEKHYMQAKRRYLQALVRIEKSKKKRVYNEFKSLQSDIKDWKQQSAPDVVSAEVPMSDLPEEPVAVDRN